jgi:adenosine kinase
MRREFGGCAGNIAYSLKLLGGSPRILATVGDDAGPYRERLDKLGIDQRYTTTIPGTYTAQAFITTDTDDNQITAFHPGAMMQSHHNHARDAIDGVKLAIVSPDGRDGMLQHIQELHAAGVPFIFDPGQALPLFSGEDLLNCLELADYCTVNDYELRLVSERTGLNETQLASRLRGLIVTLGGEGSRVHADGRVIHVPCVAVNAVVDPTGCGDTYRAGLLYGLTHGWALEKCARLASVMGGIKIEHRGGQNHTPNCEDIATRYAATFGERPW